ncbi:uncharacterized protein BKA78DRAFT_176474 [Phyllosticta capitalensis]|uniref:uncharacterized protein n=1 Tax=Phyllosticta capitalensis TaxID=121624 RepID=UPI00313128CA
MALNRESFAGRVGAFDACVRSLLDYLLCHTSGSSRKCLSVVPVLAWGLAGRGCGRCSRCGAGAMGSKHFKESLRGGILVSSDSNMGFVSSYEYFVVVSNALEELLSRWHWSDVLVQYKAQGMLRMHCCHELQIHACAYKHDIILILVFPWLTSVALRGISLSVAASREISYRHAYLESDTFQPEPLA